MRESTMDSQRDPEVGTQSVSPDLSTKRVWIYGFLAGFFLVSFKMPSTRHAYFTVQALRLFTWRPLEQVPMFRVLNAWLFQVYLTRFISPLLPLIPTPACFLFVFFIEGSSGSPVPLLWLLL